MEKKTNDHPTPIVKSQSLVSGITNEWKPNSFINKSVCGETWHEFYLQDSSEGSLDSNDCKCQAFSKTSKCLFELRYTNLLEKYHKEKSILKEKVNDLRNETNLAYKEINSLKEQIQSIHQDYTLQIHNIQARHQQKMLRTKNDIEALVKSIESKFEVQLKTKQENFINEIQEKYEEKIEKFINDHQIKVAECEKFIKDLQDKFQNEKTDWEKKISLCKFEYEEKIDSLKSEYEMEIISLQTDEKDHSFTDKSFQETIETRIKEEVQKVTEKYEDLLKQNRRTSTPKRDFKKILELSTDNSTPEPDLQEKIESYQKQIKSLQDIISSQERTIQDMSSSLHNSFKKKVPQTAKIISIFQSVIDISAEELECLKEKLECI